MSLDAQTYSTVKEADQDRHSAKECVDIITEGMHIA